MIRLNYKYKDIADLYEYSLENLKWDHYLMSGSIFWINSLPVYILLIYPSDVLHFIPVMLC